MSETRLDCYGDSLPPGVVVRLGTVRLRHGVVYSVDYDPNGDWFVTGGSDNEMRFWDSESGKELISVRGHNDPSDIFGNHVSGVAVSPLGDIVAGSSGSEISRILIYSMLRRQLVGELMAKGMVSVKSVAFSPDGRLLACAGLINEIFIWDLEKRNLICKLRAPTDEAKAVAFTSANTLIGANADKLHFWDLGKPKPILTINCGDSITSMAISSSRDLIACAFMSEDQRVLLISATKGRRLTELSSEIGLSCVCFHPNGKELLGGGKYFCFWDCDSWTLTRRVGIDGPGCGSCLAFSPDGNTMVAGGDSWNLKTGKLKQFLSHESDVQDVRFLPGGSEVLSASNDATLRTWRSASGEHLRRTELAGANGKMSRVAVTHDGQQAAWCTGGEIHFCDGMTGKEYARGNAHLDSIADMAFSNDGQVLATGSLDHTAALVDARTGRVSRTFKGHLDRVNCVCFLPEGMRLATGSSDNTIRIWDIQTGKEISCLKGHERRLVRIAVSPDGAKMISSSYDGDVYLWELASRRVRSRFNAGLRGEPAHFAFSPDSRLIAWAKSGESDLSIHLWDMAQWKEVHRLEGHRGDVSCLAFSEDGNLLASGSTDTTVLVWDILRFK